MRLRIDLFLLLGALMECSLCATADRKAPLTVETLPTWVDLPGVDGKKHSLKDIDAKFVVVAFVAAHCSLCQFQETELNAIQKQFADSGVQLIAISISNAAENTLPKMMERAKTAGYQFPYLHDASQNVGRAFKATTTPMVFLLNPQRQIIYQGAVNDDGSPIKAHYLRDALNDALSGRPIRTPLTRAIGCGIRYE